MLGPLYARELENKFDVSSLNWEDLYITKHTFNVDRTCTKKTPK